MKKQALIILLLLLASVSAFAQTDTPGRLFLSSVLPDERRDERLGGVESLSDGILRHPGLVEMDNLYYLRLFYWRGLSSLCPVLTAPDLRDYRSADSKSQGYFPVGHTLSYETLDFFGLFWRDTYQWMIFALLYTIGLCVAATSESTCKQPILHCVFLIFLPRDVLKIIRAAIEFYSIFMVYDLIFRSGAKKSSRNQYVDVPMLRGATFVEINTHIAVFIKDGIKNISPLRSMTVTVPTNAPKRRNGVKAFVIGNFFPDFVFEFFGGKVLNSHDAFSCVENVDWLGSGQGSNPCLSRFAF